MIARLQVDPIACDGRALCAEMLPELITLDDWGFPIIGDGPLPRRLLGDVRVTVRACPKLALKISDYSERPAVLPRRFPPSAGAELDGFDEQQEHGDDEIAAQGEHAELDRG